jgi:exopolyphosphatase/guanosine-5'-triphosphate,3'-diphosphate pyrophosphatase
MLVARAVGAELQVIDRLREPVRLASGLDAERQLQPEAQGRALACLQRFGQRIAHIPDERIRVVGTNTMREMRRGQKFLAAAEAALGHSIEIIAGMEEARLVYGGVVHGLEAAQARRLVVDIGGGSTELIIGRGTEPRLMESVSLGCVVHTQRHFSDGTITRSRFRRARLAARVELEYLEQRYRRAGWDLAIGASGTVRGIWRVIRAEGWSDLEITREALEKLDRNLAEVGSDKSRLLSVTVYITDMALKPQMNEIWMEWVDQAHAPQRACIGATLEEGDLIEIVAVAATKD